MTYSPGLILAAHAVSAAVTSLSVNSFVGLFLCSSVHASILLSHICWRWCNVTSACCAVMTQSVSVQQYERGESGNEQSISRREAI